MGAHIGGVAMPSCTYSFDQTRNSVMCTLLIKQAVIHVTQQHGTVISHALLTQDLEPGVVEMAFVDVLIYHM